jgi:hypothetical protein
LYIYFEIAISEVKYLAAYGLSVFRTEVLNGRGILFLGYARANALA